MILLYNCSEGAVSVKQMSVKMMSGSIFTITSNYIDDVMSLSTERILVTIRWMNAGTTIVWNVTEPTDQYRLTNVITLMAVLAN